MTVVDAGIEVRAGAVPASLDGAVRATVCTEADDRRFLLRLPHVGRLLALDGEVIIIDAAPDAHPAAIDRYVTGRMTAAIHQQRGAVVLHGAAVTDGDRTIVLTGRSGAGSSFTAAALVLDGWRLVADEHCVLIDGRVQRGRDRIGLWPAGARRLGIDVDGAPPVQPGTTKRWWPAPAHDGSAPSIIATITRRIDHDPSTTVAAVRGAAKLPAVAHASCDDVDAAPARRLLALGAIAGAAQVVDVSWSDGPASEGLLDAVRVAVSACA